MNTTRLTDRLAKSLNKRMATKVGVSRADLNLVSFKKIDKYAIMVAFCYDTTSGPIRRQHLNQYITANFGNYQPVVDTIRRDDDNGLFSIVITAPKYTKPISEVTAMATIIEGISYCDTQLRDTWEVAKNPDGSKYLIRQEADDLSNIIAERAYRLSNKIALSSKHNQAVAALLTPNISGIEKGDRVKFFYQGELLEGETSSFGANTIVINPDGKDYVMEIPINNVTTLVRKSNVNKQAKKAKEIQYFTDAYGDSDYARQLVNGSVTEPKHQTEANPSPFQNSGGQSYPAVPRSSQPDSMYYSGNPIAPTRQASQQPQLIMPPPVMQQPQQMQQQQPQMVQQPTMIDPNMAVTLDSFNIGDSVVFRGMTGIVMDISPALGRALIDFTAFTNWIDLNALQRSVDIEVQKEQQKPKEESKEEPAEESKEDSIEEDLSSDEEPAESTEPLSPINEDEDFNFGEEEEEEEEPTEEESTDPFAESSLKVKAKESSVEETEEEEKYNNTILKRIKKHTPPGGHLFEGDKEKFIGPCWVLVSQDGLPDGKGKGKIHRYLGKVINESKEEKEKLLPLAKDHLQRIARNM